jgi:plastocyanin
MSLSGFVAIDAGFPSGCDAVYRACGPAMLRTTMQRSRGRCARCARLPADRPQGGRMHTARAAIVASIITSVASATAGELDVVVRDLRGTAAVDAVVGVDGGDDRPAHEAVVRIIDQRDETFVPYVEVFRPGDSVVFRNSDRTRHHVYSFAPAKSFEFVIAPGDSTPPLPLERVGEIAVGCNIHDRMITHLYVSDAAALAKTDAQGRVVFRDLRAGRHSVRVWHPLLRPGHGEAAQAVDIGAEGRAALAFQLPLLQDPRPDPDDKERVGY